MEKRLLQLFLGFLALVLIWSAWSPFWKYQLNESASRKEDRIIFEVDKGSSAKTIAKELDRADLIKNWRSFLRTVEKEELDGSLRYGRFVLSPSLTLREIITVLTTEGTGEMALTIPEGWTITDIDAKLSELGLITSGEFRVCSFNCEFEYDFLDNDRSLEGFLFPDTYFIDSATFTSEGLINQMLSNFNNKLTDEMLIAIDREGRSLRETVIVASMVEKEVRTEADLPLVAGIIWKRLDYNWALGIDATLLYVQEDNTLTAEDLAEETPYNTRINTGLPPTAISNPGYASLMAAIYPNDSDYWFYLTDETGAVHYATTNAEHEDNKANYL